MNAIPCYGTNGLTADHLALFKQHKPETLIIVSGSGKSGRKTAECAALRLVSEGFSAHCVQLPEGEDVNSLLSHFSSQCFQSRNMVTTQCCHTLMLNGNALWCLPRAASYASASTILYKFPLTTCLPMVILCICTLTHGGTHYESMFPD